MAKAKKKGEKVLRERDGVAAQRRRPKQLKQQRKKHQPQQKNKRASQRFKSLAIF
jgi:hypothetical protein